VVAVTPDGLHVYVTNFIDGTVSVIRTATNTVVATVPGVPGGAFPNGVAITPDGKHAYAANFFVNTVSVIDTTTKMVVTTVPVGSDPGVAVTPDGNHVYVVKGGVTGGGDTVSVIDTATNTVVATVPVGNSPAAVAFTQNGKHAYVTNTFGNNVSVIRTATNTVVDTIPVGSLPGAIAITPDGKHAYVITNDVPNNFWVIDTTTRTVVAMVPAGTTPGAVAVTPDGKHAYVTVPGSVSVLRTATNTVVATVPVGKAPSSVGIVPPPPGVPFLAFSVTALDIDFDGSGSPIFNLHSQFTLSSTAPAINPVTQPVTLQVGTFSTTFPRLLREAAGRVFHLCGGDRWRELEGADQAGGHLAIHVPREGDGGREPDRDQKPGVCDPDHRGDSGATSVTPAIFP
jgi:YVTN family beta-propeller protein